MPKKIRTSSFDGVFADAKARSKHQALVQDYEELRREVAAMRSELEARKQRKIILAAETRFLRRRYKYFMKSKLIDSSGKGKQHVKPVKEFSRKEATQDVSENKPKKKKQYISKEIAPSLVTPVNQLIRKMSRGGLSLISDFNQQTNDTALRNTFDLNQASVPTRAPIFDLNKISTGDEDFHSNVNYEEPKGSLSRHPNDEVQNDLMLSICRNAGEGPPRVGKRKISWQDPVALRV